MTRDCSKTYTEAYISGACNSNSHAADWGDNDVICLAIEEAVAILKPDTSGESAGRIERTYLAHSSRVNVVKWIRNLQNNKTINAFISASFDTNAVVWIPNLSGGYVPKFILKGHTESITDVCAVSLTWQEIDYIFVATLSMDTLKLWKRCEYDDKFTCFHTIDQPEVGIGVSGLSIALLPNTNCLIIASCRQFLHVTLYTCPVNALSDNASLDCKEAAILYGHTNWVDDLVFTTYDGGNSLLLASASHDGTIRIWSITQRVQPSSGLNLCETIVSAEDKEFSVTVCSILHGHNQWIYTLQWKHFVDEEEEERKLKLLSVSADKTAIVWQKDLALNTWTESYRLGDVGGNVAGFVGGCFDPSGQFIMVNDLVGAFHMWKYDKLNDKWLSAVLPSGHNDAVLDIQWDPKGQFLVSVGADKTTRLHAPVKTKPSCWLECARPQTHGHIINSVAVLPQNRFVSGACEKELRVFIATKNFVNNFKKASFLEETDESKYPHNNAFLPSLDLSNKPADEMENLKINSMDCNGVDDEDRTIPTEEELARNTLWPEIQKLYYHPNEISCLTSTYDGKLLASACKASTATEAAIAIWSVTWDKIERIQELRFHVLTVTQLAFSPNGLYLLSVSRDRTWNLFKKKDEENVFESTAFVTKLNAIHKRQLNTCAWSHDSKYFATGSRDGKMVIWSQGPKDTVEPAGADTLNGFGSQCTLDVPDENICAVNFATNFVKTNEYLIAVGFGSGKIRLYVWNGVVCQDWLTLEKDVAHHKEVTKLAFRPSFGSQEHSPKDSIVQLASAGADRMVKIYNLDVSQFSSS